MDVIINYLPLVRVLLFLLLFAAFMCIFTYLRKSKLLEKKFNEVNENLDNASVLRARARKQKLNQVNADKNILDKIEMQLTYSGLPKRFTFLTAEIWILILLASCTVVYFVTLWISDNVWTALLAAGCDIAALVFIEKYMALRNFRAVDQQMMEFLNMLANYSITSRDITGVLNAISRYFNEPLRGVLEECYYEAQTSGDLSNALLSMAEKIEHPKFKQLVRNIEICSRYSADFSTVVKDSRKSLQEHIRNKQERKSMGREAVTNMAIIGVMLLVVLVAVNGIIETSIWHVLFQTLIGRICIVAVVAIYLVFFMRISSVDKE